MLSRRACDTRTAERPRRTVQTTLPSLPRPSLARPARPRAHHDLQLAALATAQQAQPGALAGRQLRDLSQQAIGAGHGLAVHRLHDVAHAQAGAGRRAVAQHTGDDHAAGVALELERTRQFGRDVLRFDAQPATLDLAGLDDFVHDLRAMSMGVAKPMPIEPPDSE